jgi:ubiquitin-protein ligase
MSTRARRIEAEWELLEALARTNPETLRIQKRGEEFCVQFENSPAWMGNRDEHVIGTAHEVRYCFPRYYPALPLEAFFRVPIFHPNVDPVTGFACLWLDYRPRLNIVDAIVITCAMMAFQTVNRERDHVMQPDALDQCEPLATTPLVIPEECRSWSSLQSSGRRRLS